MPKNSAQTTTLMGAQATRTIAGGQIVHVDLTFQDVPFVPANLLNAFTTQYGAGKVSMDTDDTQLGAYRLRIVP
jgi:hypothetical protein